MISLFNTFVKITGWPVQKICFRTKVYYEDKSVQSRKIKGPAIIISNHTSVFDYAVFLFVFWRRTLRYQMAEVLFKKKGLARFLKMMGGIFVDRDSYNFGFVTKSLDILNKGGVVGIFPESRLPRQGEEAPLPFKTSAAYIALSANVPIIPVYTNGSYFNFKSRARVVVGKPVNVAELVDENKSEKENLEYVSEFLRQKVASLREIIDGEKEKK